MSTTAGAFSETTLLEARVLAQSANFADRIDLQYKPDIDTINAVKAVETANIKTVTGKTKTYAVEWINTCDIAVDDNTACSISGTQTSTNTEEYELTNDKQVSLKFKESDFVDNDFSMAENIAKGLMAADKALLEWYCQYIIGVLNTNKGVNALTSGKNDVSGTDTYYLAPYWNAKLFATLSHVAKYNKFTNPVLLDGGNLIEQSAIAMANAANADGKGDAALFGSFPIYTDMFNEPAVNSTSTTTYMLSMGSLAMKNQVFNPTDGIDKRMAWWRYTMESAFVPGIFYDVFYTDECESGQNDDLQMNFKVKLTADCWVNPAGCTPTNTGILSFLCGAS